MTSGKAVITAASRNVRRRYQVLRLLHRSSALPSHSPMASRRLCQVVRDGARLNLRHVDRPVIDTRYVTARNCCRIAYGAGDESSRCFPSFRRRRDFFQTLKQQPWGARDFIVGIRRQLLLFAGPRIRHRRRAISRADNPDTGSRRRPTASAGGRIRRSTSTGPTGCRKIPCRSRSRRGAAKPAFLTDLS